MSEQLPEEMDPRRFIERVSLIDGEVIEGEIAPEELLVHHHRDSHPADVQARRFMSRLMDETGDESAVRQRMREIQQVGQQVSSRIGKILGRDPDKVAKGLFGLKKREFFFRFERPPYSADEIERILAELKGRALMQLIDARDEEGKPHLSVLLTGGTGFVGQEIIWQAASDPDIAEMVVLIRPKTIRDRKSGEVVKVLSPAERGVALLERLWLADKPAAKKFRFIAGDVEQPRLGVTDDEYEVLQKTLTHVIHCAASVAFDDPYKASFNANVLGTQNALSFSEGLQNSDGTPFVSHLSIETSYIHGRQAQDLAREDEVVFPRNYYNNFYELTKAMASLETERSMLDKKLRVTQLCPAIVIGESQAGNNRGDTKVVNAPVNVFGRAHEAITHQRGNVFDRTRAAALAQLALLFPGDASAELNLIPVDRVVAGILAATKRAAPVGERIHLATDDRLTSEQIRDIVHEELGVKIKLADPTTHRTVTLPVLTKLLSGLGQDRLAHALKKLGTIFGGYSEWGQPIHQVGNDVRLLGLDPERPVTADAFRMLCRHNRFVQRYGAIKDLDEVSRREKIWAELMRDLEAATGKKAPAVAAQEFRDFVRSRIDYDTFKPLQDAPPEALLHSSAAAAFGHMDIGASIDAAAEAASGRDVDAETTTEKGDGAAS
ncbi:MAG: SDR family oxidoreductase [Acidobacteriota bacterium]